MSRQGLKKIFMEYEKVTGEAEVFLSRELERLDKELIAESKNLRIGTVKKIIIRYFSGSLMLDIINMKYALKLIDDKTYQEIQRKICEHSLITLLKKQRADLSRALEAVRQFHKKFVRELS